MNELDDLSQPDEELLHAVDGLLEKPDDLTLESHSLLGFCAQLASTVPQAPPTFQQKLWEEMKTRREMIQEDLRLSPPHGYTGHFATWSRRDDRGKRVGMPALCLNHRSILPILAIALVIVILSAAFVPPVRALADEIIKHITLGNDAEVSQVELPTTGVTQAVTLPSEMWHVDTGVNGVGGNVPPGTDPTVRSFNSLADAQAQVSYPIIQPAYLPEGYYLQEIKVTPKGIPEVVFLFYTGPGKDIFVSSTPVGARPVTPSGTASPDGKETVTQMVSAVEMETNGSLEEARVNDNIAAWVSGDLLTWEANGFFYEVGGVNLTEDEAIQIAESIK